METKNCSNCRWGPECKLSDYVKKWCSEDNFCRWEEVPESKGKYLWLEETKP